MNDWWMQDTYYAVGVLAILAVSALLWWVPLW